MNQSDLCEVCSQPIDRNLHPRANACSSRCRVKKMNDKTRRASVDKKCVICGTAFTVEGRYGRNRLFCSEPCRAEGSRLHAENQKFKRAAEVRPPCICIVCGSEYKTRVVKQSSRNKYCSKACIRIMARRHPHTCPECGVRFHGLRDAMFCGTGCSSAWNARAAAPVNELRREKQKEAKRIREAEKRDKLARGLRLWRSGMNASDVAVACGYAESSGTSFLRDSKAYRRATTARLSESKWYEKEKGYNARSATFPTEKAFSDYAASEMRKAFEVVKTEVQLPRSKRRIDLVVESGLFRFGVELKATCRTARLDQLLGQALVKCVTLGLTPVCAIPDDLKMDAVFKRGCKSLGVMAGTLSEVMEYMCIECGNRPPSGVLSGHSTIRANLRDPPQKNTVTRNDYH